MLAVGRRRGFETTRSPAPASVLTGGQIATLIGTTEGGSALISWVAPTQSADSSALGDLAGFKIYYGTTAEVPDNVQDVSNAAATSATVTGLTAGTWYFVVTAYDTDGIESVISDRVSRVIT